MEEDAVGRTDMYPTVLLLSSLAYCHFLVSKLPRGITRVLFILPVYYIFFVFPWHFSSSLLRGVLSFYITWIASFKLLLFCFNRGPLVPATKTFIDFFAVSVFPMQIKNPNLPPANKTHTLLDVLGITIALIPTFIVPQEPFPNVLKFLLYSLSILAGLFIVQKRGSQNSRYEMVPLFNKPYSATSLQEFWGRRWNRYSSSMLRITIYDPTRHTLSGMTGPVPAKLVAVVLTLVVSGVMHELMFFYITCGTATWEVTRFFVLQGFCIVLETVAKHFARPLRPTVSNVLTVGFVVVTSYWLLVLPVWRNAKNECV